MKQKSGMAFTAPILAIFLSISCSNKPAADLQNTAAHNSISNTIANAANSVYLENEPAPTPVVRIKSSGGMVALQPSDISEVLAKYRSDHPGLSAKEIAEYGNSILPQKGFNYSIDVSPLNEKKEKSKEAKIISDDYYSYPDEMTLIDGAKQKFLLLAPRNDSCCCGNYYADLPVSNITEKTITFVADGKTYTVKRPEDFGHNEVYALVNENNLSKEIFRWQVPFEGYPLGISEDGTKLYVEGGFDDIYLEISPDGSFKFTPVDEVKSGKGESCELPENPNDSYESCQRFTVEDKAYFIKFSAPCT